MNAKQNKIQDIHITFKRRYNQDGRRGIYGSLWDKVKYKFGLYDFTFHASIWHCTNENLYFLLNVLILLY